MNNHGEITSAPIGPLTNIALAIAGEPKAACNVRRITLGVTIIDKPTKGSSVRWSI